MSVFSMRHLHAGFISGVAIAVLAEGASAQNTPPMPMPHASHLPSMALPAEMDRVLRDYEAAWRRGDAAGLAALFADDGFVLQSGRAPARGRTAIQAVYAGQGGAALRLRALAASSADTVGYIIGAYGYGDSPDDVGKFTLTLRRRPGGAWLIVSDMDNTNRAAR